MTQSVAVFHLVSDGELHTDGLTCYRPPAAWPAAFGSLHRLRHVQILVGLQMMLSWRRFCERRFVGEDSRTKICNDENLAIRVAHTKIGRYKEIEDDKCVYADLRIKIYRWKNVQQRNSIESYCTVAAAPFTFLHYIAWNPHHHVKTAPHQYAIIRTKSAPARMVLHHEISLRMPCFAVWGSAIYPCRFVGCR